MITSFSEASRRRLLRLLQSLDKNHIRYIPLFVTLTYPDTWPSSPTVWKTQLDTFCKRLARKFPGMAIIWKLEPQERGAPHFHLIVLHVRYLDWQWVAQAWYDIVGSGNPKHLQAGTQVKRVGSWNGVMHYAAKYVAKTTEQMPEGWPENVGRYWGIVGRGNVPITWHEREMSFHQFYNVRRVVRRFLRKRGVRVGVGLASGVAAFMPEREALRLLDWGEQQE